MASSTLARHAVRSVPRWLAMLPTSEGHIMIGTVSNGSSMALRDLVDAVRRSVRDGKDELQQAHGAATALRTYIGRICSRRQAGGVKR
jgi:hypothetical protein